MHPLQIYYLNQAGRGLTTSDGIGPVYATPLYLQQGHGIGNFFVNIFGVSDPILWRGAKAVVRETLRTRGKNLTNIAENRSPELCNWDIVSKHVTESVQNLIGNLRGGGGKRARGDSREKAKRARVIKRDIFS
jgi:hypothetical protein